MESTLNTVIELLDQKDYEALQTISINQLEWDEMAEAVEEGKHRMRYKTNEKQESYMEQYPSHNCYEYDFSSIRLQW